GQLIFPITPRAAAARIEIAIHERPQHALASIDTAALRLVHYLPLVQLHWGVVVCFQAQPLNLL
ncbi:MAG TPA: hypothetical protein VNH41_02390, partial [Steroidobacteraceae bacterium]|nr:hypothetical protein [Steroidobacteraceae bacterium]